MPFDRVIHLDSSSDDLVERPWRVVVADDYPIMRDVIKLACDVNPNLEVVGEAADGLGALALCEELAPDLIILDIDMGTMSGVEVARYLRDTGAELRILMLSGSTESSVAFECLRVGVDGFVDKCSNFETIAQTIEDVAAGNRVVAPQIEERATRYFGEFLKHEREVSRATRLITERELAVLEMIGLALTTAQMARRLGLSERTVESHIGKLYKKLDVNSRTAVIRKGVALGLTSRQLEAVDA